MSYKHFHYCKTFSDAFFQISFQKFLRHKQVQTLYLLPFDYPVTESKLSLIVYSVIDMLGFLCCCNVILENTWSQNEFNEITLFKKVKNKLIIYLIFHLAFFCLNVSTFW